MAEERRKGWFKDIPLHSGESTLCRAKDADVTWEYTPIEVTVTFEGRGPVRLPLDDEIGAEIDGAYEDTASVSVDPVARARLTCHGEAHTYVYWVVLP